MSIMAQDGSIKLPFASTASPAECEAQHGQPAKINVLGKTAALQPKDQISQQSENMSQMKSVSEAGNDDEVQFVFSAPRRRKRKRKRFEFSYSPSMLNQCSVPPTDPPPKPGSTTSWDPPRPRSLGVLKQLESCHIGTCENKDSVVRSGSLPVASSATVPVPNAQGSWFPDASYSSVSTLHPPSRSPPIPWWNESRPLSLTKPVNPLDWSPLHIEDSVSKKRKLDSERGAAETQRLFRQSSQISPRTTPDSILPPTQRNTRELGVVSSDMLWTSAMPSVSGPQPSNRQMFPQWSDFGWNPFEKLGTAQYGSQPSHQTMPMDLTTSDTQRPTNLSRQPRVGQLEPRGVWQQNIIQESSLQVPHRSNFESAQASRPLQSSYHQLGLQQLGSHQSVAPMNLYIPTPQPLTVLPQNDNGTSTFSPNLPLNQRGVQSQTKRTVAPPSPTHSQIMRREPSDLLRRPSLYTIPAWPSAPDARQAQIPTTTSRALPSPSSSNSKSNATKNGSYHSDITPNVLRKPPESMYHDRPSSQILDTSSQQRLSNASSNTERGDVGAVKGGSLFELPRARAGRKHCPNLIVDIAETCQELFPFAEVAERHSVPIKKVFDTFSAIIQLPLLRNADDRRRHGSLGKRRMREYRDARKAMEKAQEAERKAQMRAMKARVEEAGKKGKGPNNPSGLLKAAILNNASQASN